MVYALRMQHERMDGSFVPSLREYAAQYQIDGRRLRPNQLLMHPGPVNRGVELAAEVIDSPQALIVEQVESGVVVRMAVLYELLAGHGAPPGVRAEHDDGAPAGMSAPLELDRARRPGGHRADPRRARCSTRAPGSTARADLLVRDGVIAEHRRRAGGRRRAPRSSTPTACTPSRPSSTRTCTCARPGARTRRTSTRARRAAAAGGYCAILAQPNTEPGGGLGAGAALAARAGPGRGAHPDRLPRRDHRRAARASS